MHALIRKYQSSNLTRKQFCRQEGLPHSTFQYWFNHFRKYNNPASMISTPSFTPLIIKGDPDPSFTCRITWPSGLRIDFSGAVDARVLCSLVKTGLR
jgi:hypothetical protein